MYESRITTFEKIMWLVVIPLGFATILVMGINASQENVRRYNALSEFEIQYFVTTDKYVVLTKGQYLSRNEKTGSIHTVYENNPGYATAFDSEEDAKAFIRDIKQYGFKPPVVVIDYNE